MRPYAPFKGMYKNFPVEVHHELQYRRRGISTGIALSTIGTALRNPNTYVKVKDHHPNRRSDEYLLDTIAQIVYKLDLQGFSFNKTNFTIRFNLDMTID